MGNLFLPAEKLTIENLAKLPDSNVLQINLHVIFGAKASSDKIKFVCNKPSKKRLNFLDSDEFKKEINKFIDNHKDEIKLLVIKIGVMEKELSGK
ncbi:hypothetical protein GQQ23_08545 [Pantoea agglomerans]|uniref:hypothetical protein n=1 Tax=Enterobacter agglomerans TaxID=549 RepID=UPI0013C75820|nr:hypothetical protein [Pantoea agglomerans]NEG62382.1 hypothetical protein [Pantoea agglomerans]